MQCMALKGFTPSQLKFKTKPSSSPSNSPDSLNQLSHRDVSHMSLIYPSFGRTVWACRILTKFSSWYSLAIRGPIGKYLNVLPLDFFDPHFGHSFKFACSLRKTMQSFSQALNVCMGIKKSLMQDLAWS
uniref:Uncharacterized protein n=1 Tax=Clytia hemisphaerica TaxID=252671 RepID=A0A7M5WJR5_9CNID